MTFDIDMIKKVYAHLPEKIAAARKLLGRPMTLTEKILYIPTSAKAFLKARTSVVMTT